MRAKSSRTLAEFYENRSKEDLNRLSQRCKEIVMNNGQAIQKKCSKKAEQIIVASIQTKLRHSSPLLFAPEEEEVQLQSTSIQSDSEYDSGAFSASPPPQQTLPNSPLLSPQLVLSIIKSGYEESMKDEKESKTTKYENCPDYEPGMHVSEEPGSVSITIGHTTQLYIVDMARNTGYGQETNVDGNQEGSRKIESKLIHGLCKSEVTVNGHHLCGKKILKNC